MSTSASRGVHRLGVAKRTQYEPRARLTSWLPELVCGADLNWRSKEFLRHLCTVPVGGTNVCSIPLLYDVAGILAVRLLQKESARLPKTRIVPDLWPLQQFA